MDLGDYFEGAWQQQQSQKKQNKQVGLQTKKFLHSKRNNQQNERQPTDWKNIFANHIW